MMKKIAAFLFCFTLHGSNMMDQQAHAASLSQAVLSLESVDPLFHKRPEPLVSRMRRNKATYAFWGAHLACVAGIAASPLSVRFKAVVLVSGAVANYMFFGTRLKESYLRGVRLEHEAEFLEQRKILNSTNWLEKNGVVIGDCTYTTGFELWKAYETSADKKKFLRQFLSVVAVDSTTVQSRQVIVSALEQIQRRLADCSDQTSERYTNAGFLLGCHFYPLVHRGEKRPANIERWIWQEERGGDLFKKPLGGAYFEEYLNKEFLEALGIYETDPLARVFSLTDCRKRLGGFFLPWYQVSSWSRNGASRYYIALLRQYVFLLACRALCDVIISSQIVEQRHEVYW